MARPLERHGSLVSSGAPERASFLNGVWRRNAQQPTVALHPHYTKCHLDDDGVSLMLHVYYNADEGVWYIANAVEAPLVFAIARTDAAHPATVARSTWHLAGGMIDDGGSNGTSSTYFQQWVEFEFK